MAKKPKTPYVVTDPEIINQFKRETVTGAQDRVNDVVKLLKENPEYPVAIPIDYVHPSSFSKYNQENKEHHVALRGVAAAQKGETQEYYALLKKGPSPYSGRGRGSKLKRRKQKEKRKEQAEKELRPEHFPEPEVVDTPGA